MQGFNIFLAAFLRMHTHVYILSSIFRCIFHIFRVLQADISSVEYFSLSSYLLIEFATVFLRESDPTGKLPGRLRLS